MPEVLRVAAVTAGEDVVKQWEFGEARHALWYGDRIVFDSCRDMGLTARDARRIERLLNTAEAAKTQRTRLRIALRNLIGVARAGVGRTRLGLLSLLREIDAEVCDALEQCDDLATEGVSDVLQESLPESRKPE